MVQGVVSWVVILAATPLDLAPPVLLVAAQPQAEQLRSPVLTGSPVQEAVVLVFGTHKGGAII